MENTSSHGGIIQIISGKQNYHHLGFKDNQVNILGLDPKKAEELKFFILKKIKKNQAVRSSGL